MRAEGLRPASRVAGAMFAASMAGFLASCTMTTGPGVEMASPSYNAGGVAAVMAEVAQSGTSESMSDDDVTVAAAGSATASDDEDGVLPEQVALAPASSPEMATAAEGTEAPNASAEKDGADETAGEASTPVAVNTEPKKRGFLASFFSPSPPADASVPGQAAFAPAQASAAKPQVQPDAKGDPEPLVDLEAKKKRLVTQASFSDDALPGVRRTSLFEITHRSGVEDDSDVDLYEDVDAPLVLASAAGLARLAPNGLLKQRENVDVACLKPSLVRILKTVERHFGKRMVVTSGYRSPSHNRRVRGAARSQHMFCAAADVQIPGVSKWEIAKFVRSMPGRGGVGTYCHTASVHIDVGPERDWNWRCGGKS